jgi:hypothetical protein
MADSDRERLSAYLEKRGQGEPVIISE